ncbi:MAG: ribosome assembly cofactor RimP [Odoribacteraceae bacterium]|jgi:ribosome maturation factor RimP|nr:ribosome assembly cofactor RimP [Odoribacteraceae bacterium]
MKSNVEIKEIIASILQETNLFLVELTVSPDNVIEVCVDSMQGVSVQECMSVSRALESRLDRETGDFSLTVYSAGIGFPFKVPRQFEKNTGKRVEVKLSDGKKLEGTLLAYSETGIVIAYEESVAVEGKKKKEKINTEKEIPFARIKEVKDVVEIK